MRFAGKDLLRINKNKTISTYWINRDKQKKNNEKTVLSMEFLKEFWKYLKVRKKYWLLPTITFSIIIGGLYILTQETKIVPLIYTIL